MGEERASEKRVSKKRPGTKIERILLPCEPKRELRICRSRGMRTSLHWGKMFSNYSEGFEKPAGRKIEPYSSARGALKKGSANEVPRKHGGEC